MSKISAYLKTVALLSAFAGASFGLGYRQGRKEGNLQGRNQTLNEIVSLSQAYEDKVRYWYLTPNEATTLRDIAQTMRNTHQILTHPDSLNAIVYEQLESSNNRDIQALERGE